MLKLCRCRKVRPPRMRESGASEHPMPWPAGPPYHWHCSCQLIVTPESSLNCNQCITAETLRSVHSLTAWSQDRPFPGHSLIYHHFKQKASRDHTFKIRQNIILSNKLVIHFEKHCELIKRAIHQSMWWSWNYPYLEICNSKFIM